MVETFVENWLNKTGAKGNMGYHDASLPSVKVDKTNNFAWICRTDHQVWTPLVLWTQITDGQNAKQRDPY